MRIEISEKNCKASEKLVGVVEKKVSRLEKYFDEIFKGEKKDGKQTPVQTID